MGGAIARTTREKLISILFRFNIANLHLPFNPVTRKVSHTADARRKVCDTEPSSHGCATQKLRRFGGNAEPRPEGAVAASRRHGSVASKTALGSPWPSTT